MSNRVHLLIIMCLCAVLFVGCGGKESPKEPVAVQPTAEAQPTAEVETSIIVIPEEISEEISGEIPEEMSVDEKDEIKAFIEPLIPAEYKTDFYSVDIFTPTSGDGGMVSVQIENAAFADEQGCVDAIKSIVSQALEYEKYKDIYSFQFLMLAESQITFSISIGDAQSVTTVDEVSSNLSITNF